MVQFIQESLFEMWEQSTSHTDAKATISSNSIEDKDKTITKDQLAHLSWQETEIYSLWSTHTKKDLKKEKNSKHK